ncbi:MAG: hypothetical protein V3V08_06935 [Nannocystaceae bacterium]
MAGVPVAAVAPLALFLSLASLSQAASASRRATCGADLAGVEINALGLRDREAAEAAGYADAAVGPADGVGGLDPAEASSSSEGATWDALVRDLGRAVRAADDHPQTGTTELRRLLLGLKQHARSLAEHPAVRQLQLVAYLTLARALLSSGERGRAQAVMDVAIRTALDEVLPVASFGPSLERLHAGRLAALGAGGRGTLDVRCRSECNVIVNGRRRTALPASLLLGSYRVVVIPASSRKQLPRIWYGTVKLTETMRHAVVPWPPLAASRGSSPGDSSGRGGDGGHTASSGERRDAREAPPARLLPRWLEVGGVALGVGFAVLGATLVGLHHTCPSSKGGEGACERVYDTRVGGIASLAMGGVFLTSSIVLLGVDLGRGDAQRMRRVSVGLRGVSVGLRAVF